MILGVIFQSDIDREGMCKKDPKKQCSTICREFLSRECPGVRYMRDLNNLWIDQEKYPFSLYAELTNNEDQK